MTSYEYKTVPAPRRERRARGMKSGAEAFAHAIQTVLNDESSSGWEFQRAESLPCDEKLGLFRRRQEVLHAILIFRRALVAPAPHRPATRAEPPAPASPAPASSAPASSAPARAEPAAGPAPASLFNVPE
jgi:hypothetical protein